MSDEIVTPSAPAASSEAAPSVAETPVVPTESVVSPETPVIEAAQPEAPIVAPEDKTLLAGEKKVEEKPVEEKAEVPIEEKPVEAEPLPAPEYEAFVLPEGVAFDEGKMGEFTKTLAEFETTTKASHEEVQKLGQQLVDRHIAELQRYTESLTHAWEKQKTDWKDSFLKAPEFLNRADTVVNAAIDAIDIYGGNEAQRNEFRELMQSSGIGNHPAMIRMLSNVMLAKAEPKPLAAPQIASGEKISKMQKMYGKKTG